MVKTCLHRWDNEELLEARYGNKCFWGSGDGDHAGGSSSGGVGAGANDGGNVGGGSSGGGGWGDGFGDPNVNEGDHVGGQGPGTPGTNDGGAVGGGYNIGGYGPGGNPDVGDGYGGDSTPEKKPEEKPKEESGPETSEGEETSQADLDYAALIREQWEDYKERYGPLEEYFSDGLQDDNFGGDIVDKARQAALDMDNAEATYRHLDRYGIDLGGKEQEALAGSMQRSRIAQGQQNANTARQYNVDLQDALQKDFIGIGHGVSANATGQLGNVAAMDIQRQTAIAQMKNSQQFALYQQQLQSQAAAEQMKYANKASRGGFWGTVFGLGGLVLSGGNPAGFAAGYALGDWMAG